jgi:hypothetical protein
MLDLKTLKSILFIVFLISFISSSFVNAPLGSRSDCSFSFDKDLKTNKVKLFLIGGIAPTHVQGQEQHEKMFNFEYYDYGCTPESDECIKIYSAKVFKHLDQKHGKLWRKLVRQDVLYLRGKNHL